MVRRNIGNRAFVLQIYLLQNRNRSLFLCLGTDYFEKIAKDRWKVVLALSVPVGAVFSLCTMLFYDGGNSVMRLLNHLVSGRIYIMSSYYKTQGVSLIPRAQELFYGQYYGLIDNTYMFVFLYCGAIVALFFLWCVTKTLFRLYRGGYYKELVMIAAFALYGVLEQFIMNGFMNPFVLLCGILLYPDLLEKKRDDVCAAE